MQTRFGVRVEVAPDWMYHDVYYWGDYEPFQTKVYRRIVRLGQTVIDIGSNFGWFTVLFARWVGPAGQVHAFEPVPFIHQLATKTLALNDVAERVLLNQEALGRTRGTITIRSYEGLPHGHATAVDLGRTDATEHVCAVTTLDRYCSDRGVSKVAFIKIDVEGFEPDVFAGAAALLRSPKSPIVAFEINGECLAARSLEASDVISELRSHGYSHFYSLSTRRGVRKLDRVDFDHGDCLAAKDEHLGRLESALRTGRVFR